uniref:Cadherin domain-containing protein n=1 Tax=Oryctolagus cuniculus TaxID=9986 RepID=A0A5F9CLC9_RABIT
MPPHTLSAPGSGAGAGGASLGRRCPRQVLDTGLSGLEPTHKGPGRRRNKGLFHAATESGRLARTGRAGRRGRRQTPGPAGPALAQRGCPVPGLHAKQRRSLLMPQVAPVPCPHRLWVLCSACTPAGATPPIGLALLFPCLERRPRALPCLQARTQGGLPWKVQNAHGCRCVCQVPCARRPSRQLSVPQPSKAKARLWPLSRYAIDRESDLDQIFNIDANTGAIVTSKGLDRETAGWHNITVLAMEADNHAQLSRASLRIRILDVNDNPPELATPYEAAVCEDAKPGQLIQTISVVDRDEPQGGHRFYFRLVPEAPSNPHFSLLDIQDNTASVHTQHVGFNRQEQDVFFLPILVVDSGPPTLSSTGTLTIRICGCDSSGAIQSCNTTAFVMAASLSPGALIALLVCVLILVGESTASRPPRPPPQPQAWHPWGGGASFPAPDIGASCLGTGAQVCEQSAPASQGPH